MTHLNRICLAVLTMLLAACGDKQSIQEQHSEQLLVADTILTNGKIYTNDDRNPWAEAVAIKDGVIQRVGTAQELLRFKSTQTKMIDLQGKMAMPGMIDAHVHPVLGESAVISECLFPPTSTPDEIASALKLCIKENPTKDWIAGGRWDSNFFKIHDIGSPIKWLDAISEDKAISLADDTGHNRWVNTKALQLAKLDKPGLEVDGGKIERDAQGLPTGILLEAAMYPVLEAIPPLDKSDYLRAAISALKKANQFGITALKEAGDSYHGIEAYKGAELAGQLNVRMAVAIAITLKKDSTEIDFEKLQEIRTQFKGELIDTDFVKIFIDGVPSIARTAAMIEDYTPEVEGGKTHNGTLLVAPNILSKWVQQLDAMGITVNVHATGDRAARTVIDAVAHARKVNGDSGLAHEIAHGGFIHPKDFPRLVEFNVVADQSPAIWYPSAIQDSINMAVGLRGSRYWPIKTLLDTGAGVTAGSDWPAVLPDMNPWPGLEAMITRQHPHGEAPGEHWPEQKVDLKSALKIYLTNNAKALKLGDKIGSISKGKYADIIVLNQNLFGIEPNLISETQVELTMFGGKVVYQN